MALNQHKTWRLIDVLQWSKSYLRGKGIESPQIETEWILRDVLQLSRLEIYLQHERPLLPAELQQIKTLLLQRASGVPLQYVLGQAEFMGLTLQVGPEVLIPRPETEVLVETIIARLKSSPDTEWRILDIGTGSGCIAIALARQLPQARLNAIDISPAALDIAKANARLLQVADQIEFQELDILSHLPDCSTPYDVVVSNPPYVAGKMFAQLPDNVKNHEPHIALQPPGDELAFYRRLAAIAPSLLKPGGLLAVEIGGDYQVQPVCALLNEEIFAAPAVIRDYGGHSRVIMAGLKA